jgi:ankyrin repeat protein
MEVVKLSLTNPNISPDLMDAFGQTLLFLAARNRHDAVVKLLLKNENVITNHKECSGQMPLSTAA